MNIEVTKGKIPSAIKLVIYGAEGIGKSTFASKLPDALYIDTEGSTKHMDVSRLPSPSNWQELEEEINYVISNPTICKTLVIDTADWAEKLCINYTCIRLKVNNLEDVGFGKGYVYLEQDFKHLLTLLDEVIAKGINVCITAHAVIRTFNTPDSLESYDRYEMKLQKKITPLLKEWCDILLFANYKTTVIKDQKSGKSKGFGGERVMYTSHTPSYDAKNRFDLPQELPFDFEGIKHLFTTDNSTQPTNNQEVKQEEVKEEDKQLSVFTETDGIIESEDDAKATPLMELLGNLKLKGISSDELLKWAREKNNINANDLTELDNEFIKFINQNIDAIYSKVVEMRNPLGD